MRISDWSSDVCSSDLNAYLRSVGPAAARPDRRRRSSRRRRTATAFAMVRRPGLVQPRTSRSDHRSEERRVGKSVSVRVDLGGRRIIKKKKIKTHIDTKTTT